MARVRVSPPVEVKTHLAQYNCGCKPARGWLTTLDESKVTCARCLKAITKSYKFRASQS